VIDRMEARERSIWYLVQHSPLESLWDLQGASARVIAKRTWKALIDDRVFGHAAELGFYFLFALFPTLFCASSVLGLVARSAFHFYDRLLSYLSVLVPTQALGAVLNTFQQTAQASTSDKVTFGLIAAVWSASVGISAIQDTLNAVYNIEDSRSYFIARLQAIGLTILLVVVVTLGLASLLVGDYFSALAGRRIHQLLMQQTAQIIIHIVSWTAASALLALTFAVLYYWAPDIKKRCWHWLTPGGAA
jgi:membrane protein